MTSQNTPAWRNDDLEGAVIGAFFLRGADPEVMDILATLPADVFFVRQYRDIYAVKRRTKNAKAFHDKCENFSFRASNETAVLITAFYSLHGDRLGYG